MQRSVLRMNTSEARRLKRELGVTGGMIGRGCTTAVYAWGEDKVLKLTNDLCHYDYAVNAAPESRFAVNVVENLGYIGQIGNQEIRGYVSERLYPISGSNSEFVRGICEEFEDAWQTTYSDSIVLCWRTRDNQRSVEALRKLMKKRFVRPVQDVLRNLETFLLNWDCAVLDFHDANFMQRADGSLVFNDPVVVSL